MARASRISSNFGENISDLGACMSADSGTGSDADKQSLYIPAKEEKIHSQSSTFCRYYPAGSCRRGSACRFGHLQPPSVPQGMVFLAFISSSMGLRCGNFAIRVCSPQRTCRAHENVSLQRRRILSTWFGMPFCATRYGVSSVCFISHGLICKESCYQSMFTLTHTRCTRGHHIRDGTKTSAIVMATHRTPDTR
jgi:hypothetical protein